jgi:hypothetical protein
MSGRRRFWDRFIINGEAAGPSSRAAGCRNRKTTIAAPTQKAPATMCTIRSTTM